MTTHALTRAKERYDIDLTQADLSEIRRDIRDGHALLLSNNADGCQVFAVYHQRVYMRLIYAPNTGAVITFLPANAPLPKRRRPREKQPRKVWRDGRMHSVVT